MDRNSAIDLLDDTFNNEFDLERFSIFISELFNSSVRSPKGIPLRKEYEDYISELHTLRTYKLDNKKIEVFIVKLKKSSSRDRARTMQRNLIAHYLKLYNLNAALVAFYGEDPEDWRFSFVKMEYELIKDEKGNLLTKENLTPAARYSFLVGKNEPNHTCKSRFKNLIIMEDFKPSLEEIEKAFSIEKVTKDFFEKYKDLYIDLEKSLEKVIKKDPVVKKEFEDKHISNTDFAKKLMGQIVFIYFLQKKGWLGVKKSENWGEGPKNFLKQLFNKNKNKNFFNDVLEYLFYDALSTDRYNDYYDRFECKIPFLNGGLFEPINNYNWQETEVLLDNKIFKKIFKTFDCYNFTVKEDEPLEREVAVDPEMLGNVFEKLLEVKDKKAKGAFYTPREVVHYMCQQSLISYLETNTDLPIEDIKEFILLSDFALDSIIRTKVKKSKKYALPKSILENQDLIDHLLKEVKIADPAVGSGAFPVGMMNEIVKARSILSLVREEERTNYDLKRETIENSLYGVDIDSSAIDITKLRFWLSLIVDESSIDNIKPLPNLDHQIMCGNSLLDEFQGIKLFDDSLINEINRKNELETRLNSLYVELGKVHTGKIIDPKLAESIKKEIKKLEKEKNELSDDPEDNDLNPTLFENIQKKRVKKTKSKELLVKLDELNNKYFNELNKKEKEKLREEIDGIHWYLIEETLKNENNKEAIKKLEKIKKDNSKPFFLWKLYFSEIFKEENPGFDIVIGNPPYKSSRGINEKLKKEYKDKYGFSDDLYNYFFVKSFEILKSSGIISFITSNTYFTINSKLNLRNLFQSNLIKEIIKIENVFDDPEVEPAIIILKKINKTNSEYEFIFKDADKSLKNAEIFNINVKTYRDAINKVFFVPSTLNLEIYDKYLLNLVKLHENFWDKISDSKRIKKHEMELTDYRCNLKDFNLTLLGMITEGGVGLQTADNGRFVGVLSGTESSDNILKSRPEKLFNAIEKYGISELIPLIKSEEAAKEYLSNIKETEIWGLFDNLKKIYGKGIFGKGYLYRIISEEKIFNINKITEEQKINGISGEAYFVPYDKGDKEGNRWFLETPFLLDWSIDSVEFFKKNSGKGNGLPYVRNPRFYFKEGFCWNNVLNPNSKFIKCRLKSISIHDVASMSLFPVIENLSAKYLVCLINSSFIFHYQRNFVNNTVNLQMNDFRQLPIIVPDKKILKSFERIFDDAYKVKRDYFDNKISKEQTKLELNKIQNILDNKVNELYGINLMGDLN